MNSILLCPYVIRLKQRHQQTAFEVLDALPCGRDFRDMLIAFLKLRKVTHHVDETGKTALQVEEIFQYPVEEEQHEEKAKNVKKDLKSTVSGFVDAGDYGIVSILKNIVTNRKRHRTKDDCELLRYFFYIEFRAGQDEALLVIQRQGTHGTLTNLTKSLSGYLEADDNDYKYTLSVNPIATEESIKKALGGGIKKLRYIKTEVPKDVANDLHLNDNEQRFGSMELVINTRREESFSLPEWVSDFLGGTSKKQYLEINGVEYDDMKLEVDVDGRTKTMQLNELTERFRSTFSINENVEFDQESGMPTYESLMRQTEVVLPELRRAIKWT